MPRINRNDVEFDGPDGKVWVAKFVHQHNDTDGILHMVDGKMVRGRHLTICKLGHKGSHVFLQGFSLCSMKEEYNWKFGLKQALNRALAKGRFCTEQLIEGGGCKFIPLGTQYGIIISAFYREMPIKAYWPHNYQFVEVYEEPTRDTSNDAREVPLLPVGCATHHVVNRAVRPSHGLGAVEAQ